MSSDVIKIISNIEMCCSWISSQPQLDVYLFRCSLYFSFLISISVYIPCNLNCNWGLWWWCINFSWVAIIANIPLQEEKVWNCNPEWRYIRWNHTANRFLPIDTIIFVKSFIVYRYCYLIFIPKNSYSKMKFGFMPIFYIFSLLRVAIKIDAEYQK